MNIICRDEFRKKYFWVRTAEKFCQDSTEETQLFVFLMKVLLKICGPKKENEVYRRSYNFKFERKFGNPSFGNVVKTNRLRFAGHMIPRPEDLPLNSKCEKTMHFPRI
jgi:hypothetical protein